MSNSDIETIVQYVHSRKKELKKKVDHLIELNL